LDGVRDTGQGPAAQGQDIGSPEAVAEPAHIALKQLEVGEEMMGEEDGWGEAPRRGEEGRRGEEEVGERVVAAAPRAPPRYLRKLVNILCSRSCVSPSTR